MKRMGWSVGAVPMVAVMLAAELSWVPVLTAADAGQAGLSYAGRGYRLVGYRWDTVLGRRWAVYDAAAHPEWPRVSLLDPVDAAGVGEAAGGARLSGALPGEPAVQTQRVVKVEVLLVRSGEAVTLWKDEGNVRMQLAAVSEGNAGLGGRVQLRVTGAGIFGSSGWQTVGVVRGPGSVEME